MNEQHLYYDDPTMLEFDARALLALTMPDGRPAVILDRTCFYPTGGGQEHDTGSLLAAGAEARVIEVLKDEDIPGFEALLPDPLPAPGLPVPGLTVHILDRPLPPGPVHASIDGGRRLRHMQHHTAQHLLTLCFSSLFGLETVSANINGDSPSTLDLLGREPTPDEAAWAEALANARIYADRPVRTYFAAADELAHLPLRKQPSVTEHIRIIEIDGEDYSPCGGTHVASTARIGIIKIVRLERLKDRTRVHFIAGERAYQVLSHGFEILKTLADGLSAGMDEVPALVQKQAEALRAAQKEAEELRRKLIPVEAGELLERAIQLDGFRLIYAGYAARSPGELRLLAQELRKTPDLIAILAAYDGGKLSLVVGSGGGKTPAADAALRALLASLGGRGGGDKGLAQGGAASPDQFEMLAKRTPDEWKRFFTSI